jgi:hypothetical protein
MADVVFIDRLKSGRGVAKDPAQALGRPPLKLPTFSEIIFLDEIERALWGNLRCFVRLYGGENNRR